MKVYRTKVFKTKSQFNSRTKTADICAIVISTTSNFVEKKGRQPGEDVILGKVYTRASNAFQMVQTFRGGFLNPI